MRSISLTEIVDATQGEVVGDLPASTWFRWIERNSRTIAPGDCFIAVRGERFDGHQFVEDAASRGATAALVSRSWANANARRLIPLIVVDEPVEALQRVATARRKSLPVEIVGITGSVGKTSTKEVVAAVLSQRFKTYRSPGNMNSEIGLPLSLLEIEPDHEMAVLEMGGAYAFGELALLAEIAGPSIALVTNVFPVHLERMGTIEAIAKTKAELVEAIDAAGTVVLNGDDTRVREMATLSRGKVITYGLGFDNDIRAERVRSLGTSGVEFSVIAEGVATDVQLPLVGSHATELALAGFAVGYSRGMTIPEMIPGFFEQGVQVRLVLQPGPSGSQIIDDTYNASTPSVLSALSYLAEIPAERKLAVLGDMREMGELTEREHRIVGRSVAEIADEVVTFGEAAMIIADEVRKIDGRTQVVTSFGLDDRSELEAFLLERLRPGDVALLKGSRGLEMESFVKALRAAASVGASPE